MKICNLILFYSPYYSGRGTYWKKVMREMAAQGIDSWVLAANYDNLEPFEIVEGVPVHRVPLVKGEHQVFESLKIAASLYRLREKFDILHMHGYCDAWGIILLLMKFLGKKIIFHMTLLGSDDPLSWKNNYKLMKLRYKLLSWIDKFISHSPPITDAYKKSPLPDYKLIEIPNGVDTNIFIPAKSNIDKCNIRKKLKLPIHGTIACFVGAVIERKGIHVLVDLWSKDEFINKNCTLLIVGPYRFAESGQSQQRYYKKILFKVKSRNLNVLFVGSVDNVEEYMRGADFFVFPSQQEGFGNVIIEALASGLPVLASPLDGISSRILGEHAGYVISDSSQWSEMIQLFICENKQKENIAASARKRAVEHFDLKRIVKEYISVYFDLIGCSSGT